MPDTETQTLIERLRDRIATLDAMLDLREHDCDKLFERTDRAERMRRRALDAIDRGEFARAKAILRWHLAGDEEGGL